LLVAAGAGGVGFADGGDVGSDGSGRARIRGSSFLLSVEGGDGKRGGGGEEGQERAEASPKWELKGVNSTLRQAVAPFVGQLQRRVGPLKHAAAGYNEGPVEVPIREIPIRELGEDSVPNKCYGR
jgi:hypothetical protein